MILHTKDIRAWDAYTIANEPIASVKLMERAARALAKALLAHLKPKQQVLVFCGNGNNGGDGVALAYMLHRLGYSIAVCYLQHPQKGSEDFKYWNDKYTHIGGRVVAVPDWQQHTWDVLLDAVLGTGLNRPLEGELQKRVQDINSYKATKVAVDTPTGLLCNTWQNAGNTIFKVDLTYTFQAYKWAFVNPENLHHTGKIIRLDIGLLPEFQPESIQGQLLDTDYFAKQPSWIRSLRGEKAEFGSTLIIGGNLGMVGAANFAGKAAVRCGSGWTQIAAPKQSLVAVQSQVPEATAVAWETLDERIIQKASTVVLGPGLGKSDETTALVKRVLDCRQAPLVVDADALNTIAEQQWLQHIPQHAVLTPHQREFQRLFGSFNNQEDRLAMQQEHSEKWSVYILYKGSHSTLSTPEGKLFFNCSGNAALAKAGSGDILSGMLGGLASRMSGWEDALTLGTYLHGSLADLWVQRESAESFNPGEGISLISSAITALFPNVDLT